MEGTELDTKVAVQTNLTFAVPPSFEYYGCELFPESCAHCGETENLTQNDVLKGNWVHVLPICAICKSEGLPYPCRGEINHAKTTAQQARVKKLRVGTEHVTADKKRKKSAADEALDTGRLVKPR